MEPLEVPACLQIPRKPVPSSHTPVAGPAPAPAPAASLEPDEKPPPLPRRPSPEETLRPDVQLPVRPVSRGEEPSSSSSSLSPSLQVPHPHRLRPQASLPDLSRLANSPAPSPPASPSVGPAATFGPAATQEKKSFVQTAISEARYFAGGLIPHPTESTKHYTILRHSPALIFYHGPATSVAITIFSSPDHPLPADRTLWLQQRGFTGDSGMKIKAFFNFTDDWLHVTPSTQVLPQQVAHETERAWQRDIGKAAKKLLKEKGAKKAHVPRETHVVRIPESAEDGYFRIILCTGVSPYDPDSSSKRKILCTSPIVRVASTSADSSVFRGASLSSLPLEMGVFAASMAATSAVDTFLAPVKEPISAVLDKVRPGFVAETIGGLIYDELSERRDERDAEEDLAFYAAHQAHVDRAIEADRSDAIHPIGPDSGPEPPFPLRFQGKVVRGTGRSQAELGMPTANLTNVPDEIRFRLNGIYFGWARVQPPPPPKDGEPDPLLQGQQQQLPYEQWHEAIISIAPPPDARPSVKPTRVVAVHFISTPQQQQQVQQDTLLGTTVQALIAGVLRPAPSAAEQQQRPQLIQARLDAASRDVCRTLASLGREGWTAEAVLARLARLREERGLAGRLDDAKEQAESRLRKVPTVPVHRVGIRTGRGHDRDRVLGSGGYWIQR